MIADCEVADGRSRPRRREWNEKREPKYPALVPLARRLEDLRLERRLTQRELARRAAISRNHYEDIAQANGNPSLIVIMRLAAVLGVSVPALFEPEAPKTPDGMRLVAKEDLRELADASKAFAEAARRVASD